MAIYKVIQDIEAEDKLLGPLTLKQFIYAGITAVCLYISFLALTKHADYLLVIFMPFALLTGFFAWPWGKEQPTEIWALAKIRFLFKAHKRLWDQSGVKELVTITAPKKIEHNYTNGLSQTEVTSRLKALADTIDSRGWAVKNVNVNLYSQPTAALGDSDSDRLIDVANLPQDVPAIEVSANDDIFQSSVADHFGQMITATNEAHRQSIMQQLHQAAVAITQPAKTETPPTDNWFLQQPSAPATSKSDPITFGTQIVAPGTATLSTPPTAEEEELTEDLRADNEGAELATSHLHTIQPLSTKIAPPAAEPTPGTTPSSTVTQPPDPAILELANDNDKNVATIARMANRANQAQKSESSDDEIVISLR